jgi:ribonucleoside-diphosphate reductase alpha chain
MDQAMVKTTLNDLMKRIETLQAENTKLREQKVSCARAVERLVAKVEGLQVANGELRSTERRAMYRQRPPVMRGRTVQANVGCGPLYITLNEDESGKPFEVFFKLGKSGSCQQSYLEAIGVAMSVGLRYGADPQKFVEKFEGMRCPNPKLRDASGPTTLSCADGISQGLSKALQLALPGNTPEGRHEADVVAVAEPKFPLSPEDRAENEANAKSIDLVGLTSQSSNGHNGGYAMSASTATATATVATTSVRKAMLTGVGMCPKCGGNLISQGGCIQCLQQCGYVGKCS